MRRILALLVSAVPLLAEDLRPLSTDRPDTTESPYTVPEGHVQLELEVASYLEDRSGEEWGFGLANLKLGLWGSADVQLLFDTWIREESEEGFGDMGVRFKWNLWGNDGGKTAFAAMPFVLFPTSETGLGLEEVEWGLILPLAVDLPRDFAAGFMLEMDWVADEGGSGHDVDFVQTATVSHSIVGGLGGFLEVVSVFPGARGSDWEGYFDAGLTYALDEDTQLDLGVNLGLNDAAADLRLFAGVSVRW
jgi:hypothetical protein